jgi:hypothetical protein
VGSPSKRRILMLKNFSLAALTLIAQVASAEDGANYSQIFSCQVPGGVVRFDQYLGYGNGSSTGAPLSTRIQLVIQGEPVATLTNAGLYPTKRSSVPGEFLLDELETREPGAIWTARTTLGARPSVYAIALDREQATLVITEYYGMSTTSVTLTDIECHE